MNLEIKQIRSETEIDQLTELWEASVKATHHFITAEDIAALKPMVKEGLKAIETLVVSYRETDGSFTCFMGVEAGKIEMLFAHPQARGQGLGKAMIQYAVKELGATLVDVNEQNEAGAGFYRHLGFQQIGRSELDEQGNPFPILHLQLMSENGV